MRRPRSRRRKNISGERIAAIRKGRGITQLELSEMVRAQGIALDRAAIAKIENGLRRVLDYELLALSRALRRNVGSLIMPDGTFPHLTQGRQIQNAPYKEGTRMNTYNIPDELRNVTDAGSYSVKSVMQMWMSAPAPLQTAAVESLRVLRRLADVKFRARHKNGISGYGADRATGRERECFHLKIRTSRNDLAFTQHGEVSDPDNFFCERQPGNDRIRGGYMNAQQLDRLPYVVRKMCESYGKITGTSVDPAIEATAKLDLRMSEGAT